MGTVKEKVPLPVTEYDYYEVFAREESDGPLAHIGCLSGANPETALAQARSRRTPSVFSPRSSR